MLGISSVDAVKKPHHLRNSRQRVDSLKRCDFIPTLPANYGPLQTPRPQQCAAARRAL